MGKRFDTVSAEHEHIQTHFASEREFEVTSSIPQSRYGELLIGLRFLHFLVYGKVFILDKAGIVHVLEADSKRSCLSHLVEERQINRCRLFLSI